MALSRPPPSQQTGRENTTCVRKSGMNGVLRVPVHSEKPNVEPKWLRMVSSHLSWTWFTTSETSVLTSVMTNRSLNPAAMLPSVMEKRRTRPSIGPRLGPGQHLSHNHVVPSIAIRCPQKSEFQNCGCNDNGHPNNPI
eukprot:5045667-Pyramimonas_sp.AAC.1